MKKSLIYGLMSATMLTMASSCAQEEIVTAGGDLRINVELPSQLSTRAFGDGTKARQLTYAVYQVDGQTLTKVSEETLPEAFATGLKTTISPKLVTGKTYRLAFWAQVPGQTAYVFTAPENAAPGVTVSYDGLDSNDETRDAFFASADVTVNGPSEQNVKLIRPFAQLNLGSDDLDEASVAVAYADLRTKVETTAYTALDLFSGNVEGPQSVIFGFAPVPNKGVAADADGYESFPVDGYEYLSMNYLLVPSAKSVVDIDFTVSNGETEINSFPIAAAPVQANYRTNIYGQLLTSTTDFNVEIVPAFDGDGYDYPVDQIWNGDVVKPVVKDNTVTISSPKELAGLAMMVQDGDTDFEGVTINLNADIDLNNLDFMPIGSFPATQSSDPQRPFKGTFNGNGHKIVNLKSSHEGTAALFGYVVAPASISDVVIENASISGSRYAGGVAGLLHMNANATPAAPAIKGVTVRNSVISSSKKCGGITGFFQSNIDIEDCLVENCTITATSDVGGLFGFGTYGAPQYTVIKNNTVRNSIVQVKSTSTTTPLGDIANTLSGGKGGQAGLLSLNGNNVADNVTVVRMLADGFVQNLDGSYNVSTPQGLAKANSKYFVNGGVYNITADLDMTGIEWIPTDVNASAVITVNGNNHTISNLTSGYNTTLNLCGFLGHIANSAEINDLTIANSTFNGNSAKVNSATGAFAAWIEIHETSKGLTLNNCKAIGNTYTNTQYMGGLIGYQSGCVMRLTDCLVKDCTLDSTGLLYHCGGVLGYANSNSFGGVTVEDCTITSGTRHGALVGTAQSEFILGTDIRVINVMIGNTTVTADQGKLIGLDNRADKSNAGVSFN